MTRTPWRWTADERETLGPRYLRRVPLASVIRCNALVHPSTGRLYGVEVLGAPGVRATFIERATFDDHERAIALIPHMPDVRDAMRLARELETTAGAARTDTEITK